MNSSHMGAVSSRTMCEDFTDGAWGGAKRGGVVGCERWSEGFGADLIDLIDLIDIPLEVSVEGHWRRTWRPAKQA